MANPTRNRIVRGMVGNNSVLNPGHAPGSLAHYALDRQARGSRRIIPLPLEEAVVQRPDLNARLERLLSEHGHAVLWGPHGSGKTLMALDYAYRLRQDSRCSVFWVNADNEATFTSDYKAIARELGIYGGDRNDQLLTAVRDAIMAQPAWVLILDNADNLKKFGVGNGEHPTDTLSDYVPPLSSKGKIIWTSRHNGVKGTLVDQQCGIRVAAMAPEEANELLRTLAGDMLVEQDEDASMLLEALKWHAQAISLAGKYMRHTQTPVKRYYTMLRQAQIRWSTLKKNEGGRTANMDGDIPHRILETWSISMSHIRQVNSLAYNVLNIMAYFNNHNISYKMIKIATRFLIWDPPTPLDESKVARAIEILNQFSLLSMRPRERGHHHMSKMVQNAARYGLFIGELTYPGENVVFQDKDVEERGESYFTRTALNVVAELFPTPKRETWRICDQYLSHVMQVLNWADFMGNEVRTANLLERVSDFFHHEARWQEKEPVDEMMVSIWREMAGEDAPETIVSKASLLATHHELGRYDDCKELSSQVLGRREHFEESDEVILKTNAYLAATHHAQGSYKEAEELRTRVLEIQRSLLGVHHPQTLSTMGNLAATYYEQGRDYEAERMMLNLLRAQRQVFGAQTPDTIRSMLSLAALYLGLDRNTEAINIMALVLEVQPEVFGAKHPETLMSMVNLMATYRDQGHHLKGENLCLQLLNDRRELLKLSHPGVLRAMYVLAKTWNRLGYVDCALSQAQHCHRECVSTFGTNDPFTWEVMRLVQGWDPNGEVEFMTGLEQIPGPE